MEWLSDPEAWIALLTLTVLEIVLGIDNVIFISILAGKLPAPAAEEGAPIGLAMAMIMRVLLLLSLAWIVRLTAPLFTDPRAGDLRPRPDPARRRPVPDRQGHARDSRQAGRARRATPSSASRRRWLA